MSDFVLQKIDGARRLLMCAQDAPECKKVVDAAKAAEIYAKRQKMSDEIVGHATAIKVEAMALMGEFLARAEMNKGAIAGGKKESSRGAFVEPRDISPTLSDIGITKRESSQSQALAMIKEEEPETFEAIRTGEISLSRAIAEINKPRRHNGVITLSNGLMHAQNAIMQLEKIDQKDTMRNEGFQMVSDWLDNNK